MSIEEVARRLFDTSEIRSCISPGYCLNCNSYLDLDSFNANLSETTLNMTRYSFLSSFFKVVKYMTG
jgi:hypothetical protein